MAAVSGLADEQSGVADGLVVGIGGDGGAEPLDLKEVEGAENACDIPWNDDIGQLFDDEQVDTVTVSAEDIFGGVFKILGIVL